MLFTLLLLFPTDGLLALLACGFCGRPNKVPGVYEGGLRVWEGSLDLVRYLDAHRNRVRGFYCRP